MLVESAGFIIAAVVARWYPVISVAIVIFSTTWLGLSFTPREIYNNSLPSRKEFLRRLQAIEVESGDDECPICYTPFTNPCQLPCRHTYCRPCLELLFTSRESQHRCPQCQKALFRQMSNWKHIVVKFHCCVNAVLASTCISRISWDVAMLLRADESIFDLTLLWPLSDLSMAMLAPLTAYWPYFMSSGRDRGDGVVLAHWLRVIELVVHGPVMLKKVWSLQHEVGHWWTADAFRKFGNVYAVEYVVTNVGNQYPETTIETFTAPGKYGL